MLSKELPLIKYNNVSLSHLFFPRPMTTDVHGDAKQLVFNQSKQFVAGDTNQSTETQSTLTNTSSDHGASARQTHYGERKLSPWESTVFAELAPHIDDGTVVPIWFHQAKRGSFETQQVMEVHMYVERNCTRLTCNVHVE